MQLPSLFCHEFRVKSFYGLNSRKVKGQTVPRKPLWLRPLSGNQTQLNTQHNLFHLNNVGVMKSCPHKVRSNVCEKHHLKWTQTFQTWGWAEMKITFLFNSETNICCQFLSSRCASLFKVHRAQQSGHVLFTSPHPACGGREGNQVLWFSAVGFRFCAARVCLTTYVLTLSSVLWLGLIMWP